jgi:hypothetical protein
MRTADSVVDLVPARPVTEASGEAMVYCHGDPAVPSQVVAGAKRWSRESHFPSFVLVQTLAPGLSVVGCLRFTQGALRLRVEVVEARQRLSGVMAMHVAGSSGIVLATDGEVAGEALVRALPREVIARRSIDEVWIAEQEVLGLERLDAPVCDCDDTAHALRCGDRLVFRAMLDDVRDALFALVAMGGREYSVH